MTEVLALLSVLWTVLQSPVPGHWWTLQLGHPKDGEAALLPPVAEHVEM